MGLFGSEAAGTNSLHRPLGMTTWVGVIVPPSQLTPPKAVMSRLGVDDEDTRDDVIATDTFGPAETTVIKVADIKSKYKDVSILTLAVAK